MMSQPITRTVRHLVLAASNEDGLKELGPKFALQICKTLSDGSLRVLTSKLITFPFGVGLATPVGATPPLRSRVFSLMSSSSHDSIRTYPLPPRPERRVLQDVAGNQERL